MKRTIVAALLAVLILNTSFAQTASDDAFERWQSDKYSMFIHFGLYSYLGGVWAGEPVREGYSEQIQSFAGIFSDWYAMTAENFNPENFNADEIAGLAVSGGMRSIVFTSKHHDGFCMFDTETTTYNSVDQTPSHRDYVREISEACRKAGLKFGLYFSLIDWNFPHAYPISSHNADFVTPEHHEFNKAQVRELLTKYGPVSELWFDMGSLQPHQSRELYDLVKSLQPSCMVSGRLGNDVYDFAVMADNKFPDTALHAPWQSAASMFPETWSYRSWQERGNVKDKVAEKLRSLIEVVSHGGNYLLNIGPASDGSVVPFEKEVILAVGQWLEKNGHAVYGASPSPFKEKFAWGDVTAKDGKLYLFLTGTCPEGGFIHLPVNKRGIKVMVTPEMYAQSSDVEVIEVPFDMSRTVVETASVPDTERLTWKNASAGYSYSCFDYYSNYKSTVSYTWDVDVRHEVRTLKLLYTEAESGRKVRLSVDGNDVEVRLEGGEQLHVAGLPLAGYTFAHLRGGVFDNYHSWTEDLSAKMKLIEEHSGKALINMPASQFSNYLMTARAEVPEDGLYMMEITSGNGVEVVVDGVTMTKHLNPYRTVSRCEQVLLELTEGEHDIYLRAYNRFENELNCGMIQSSSPVVYSMDVVLPEPLRKGKRLISISAADHDSEHKDCNLHNLIITM